MSSNLALGAHKPNPPEKANAEKPKTEKTKADKRSDKTNDASEGAEVSEPAKAEGKSKSADFVELMQSLTGVTDDPLAAKWVTPDQMSPDQLVAFQQQNPHFTKPTKGLRAEGKSAMNANGQENPRATQGLAVSGPNGSAHAWGGAAQEQAGNATGSGGQVGSAAQFGDQPGHQPGTQADESGLFLFLQQRLEMLKFGSVGHGAQDSPILNASQVPAGLLAAPSAAGSAFASLEQAAKLESKGGSSEPSWMMAGRAQLDSTQTVQGASASDSGMMSEDEHHVAEDLKFWASRNIQNAEFKLEGWEDASVQVRVSLQGSSANVEFLTDHADSRAMLANSQDELKQLLEQQGLMLSGVSVGGSMSQPSTSERFGNSGPAPIARARPAGSASSGADLTASLGENLRAVRPGLGAVDLYV
jgi:flagellar hook-length control protein FliK